MPTIADFTVVQDETFTLPTESDQPLSQREFRNVSFPAVSISSPAVLMFRVTMFGDASTIQVRINSTVVTRQTFEPGKHAWVEVIPRGALEQTGNAVMVSVTSDNQEASILVGSIVIQFQAAIAA